MTRTFLSPSFGKLQSISPHVVKVEAEPDSHWTFGRIMYVHEQALGLPDLLTAHIGEKSSLLAPWRVK